MRKRAFCKRLQPKIVPGARGASSVSELLELGILSLTKVSNTTLGHVSLHSCCKDPRKKKNSWGVFSPHSIMTLLFYSLSCSGQKKVL